MTEPTMPAELAEIIAGHRKMFAGYTMTVTTGTTTVGFSPDVNAFDAEESVPEALILQTSTRAGDVDGDEPVVRVTWVEDGDAEFVGEGEEIDPDAVDTSEISVHTGKVAKLIKISREQYYQQQTSERLSAAVARAVTKRANLAYIQQAAPTAPATTPPAGLLDIVGLVNGGAVANNLDKLVDLVATLEDNGGAPSHWLMSSAAWARLRKLKRDATSNEALLGAGTTDAVKMLLDIPVLTSGAVPAGTGLLVSQSDIASVIGSVMVAASEHFYFGSDSVALRCTWRFGQDLPHPNRCGKFTIA